MPKCPKCGENINFLINYATTQYIFEIDKEGMPKYSIEFTIEDGKYHCPKCKQLLFTSEDEAIEFLKQIW